jgi:hypothetical protein
MRSCHEPDGTSTSPIRRTSHAPSTRVLLVEDDLLLREMLSLMLSTQGYGVVEAGDGGRGEGRYSSNERGLGRTPSPLPVVTLAFASRDRCSCSRYTTSPTGPSRVGGRTALPQTPATLDGSARATGQRGASGRFQLAGNWCGNGRIGPQTRAYMVKRTAGRTVT